MPARFPHYTKIKDRYCIAYFGNEAKFVEQLKVARPLIEAEFPGLEIHLSCRDTLFHLLLDEPNRVPESQIRDNRYQYAYVRVISYNMKTSPVIELLKESGIDVSKIDS